MSQKFELRLTWSLWKISHDPIELVGRILRPPRIYGIILPCVIPFTFSSNLWNTSFNFLTLVGYPYDFLRFVGHLLWSHQICGKLFMVSLGSWDVIYDHFGPMGHTSWLPRIPATSYDFLGFVGHPLWLPQIRGASFKNSWVFWETSFDRLGPVLRLFIIWSYQTNSKKMCESIPSRK